MTEIESTIRFLELELGLYPIWHQREDRIDTHLFIATVAYHAVHLLRTRLTAAGVALSWWSIGNRMSDAARINTSVRKVNGALIVNRQDASQFAETAAEHEHKYDRAFNKMYCHVKHLESFIPFVQTVMESQFSKSANLGRILHVGKTVGPVQRRRHLPMGGANPAIVVSCWKNTVVVPLNPVFANNTYGLPVALNRTGNNQGTSIHECRTRIISLERRITMRNFNLTPQFSTTVGLDLFPHFFGNKSEQYRHRPYNIEKMSDNDYRISIEVPGYSEDDIEIEAVENKLAISARKSADKDGADFLHRGIVHREFEQSFELAAHMAVENASIDRGVLHINLKRMLPDELQPRRIEIAGSDRGNEVAAAAV